MEWGILNLGMLFGLVAVAVPVLIHLLHRRRHDVVAWGAMQFLPSQVATRRRRLWDELPLMLLRMGLLALIVLALAGPYSNSAVFAPLSERPPRDVVIVLDGSFSMDRRDERGATPWDKACRWAAEHVAQMGRGERAALIVARKPPLAWQPTLTTDRGLLQTKLATLPPPRGNAGLPQALAEAWRLLRTQSEAGERDIVVLTDRQLFGWTDDDSLRAWEALARQLRSEAAGSSEAAQVPPRLIVLDVARDSARSMPNLALAPLTSSRALASVGQQVKFTSALHGDERAQREQPGRLRVRIDERPTPDVPWPGNFDAKRQGAAAAQTPVNFTARFDKAGLHVVTLILEQHEQADALAVDNEQHVVVEVVADLPVLLVDGDRQLSSASSTFFIEKALSGAAKHSVVLPRVVPVADLTAAHILGASPQTRPRVIVLADVPELTAVQQEAMEAYVKAGGNVLVTLGPRGRGRDFNERLYRDGQGWLPARLVQVAGEAGGAGERAEIKTFQHPALELFRKGPGGGLGQVMFPRWWKIAVGDRAGGVVAARLGNGDPLLVEKVFGKGRVLLCSVPVDRGWDSPLPGTWEFPVLMHKIVFYLAGARASDWLLTDGQPMRVRRGSSEDGRLIVQTPEVASKTVQVRDWPWTDADTGAIGLYRVEREDGTRQFFVVPPDARESEDRRCNDEEWQRVLSLLPMRATTDDTLTDDRRHELWWLILLAVSALLCVEVFLTRRLARARKPMRVSR
jgi:hypothetical protein